MNEDQNSQLDSESSTEDREVLDQSSEEVEKSTIAEKFQLEHELLNNEEAKDFKSLLESYVNDHGVPSEKVTKLVDMIEKGAENLEEMTKKIESDALANYEQDFLNKKKEAFESWAYDPKNISSTEELERLQDFAKKRLGDTVDKDDVNDLLSSKSFMQYMKAELSSYKEKSPLVSSGLHERSRTQELQEKLRQKFKLL